MVTTFYPPYHFGGDANYVRQLVHTLAKKGHEVDVIHLVDAYRIQVPDKEPEYLDEPKGVTIHKIESRWPKLASLITHQTGFPLVHIKEIRNIYKQRNFDVIHFHNLSLIGGPGLLTESESIKVYTAHEHWLICPTHVLWRHNREVCTKRQCIRCQIIYKRPIQLWRYTGLLERKAKSVDIFFSPSHFSAKKHQQFGFSEPMENLPSFIPDLPKIERKKTDKDYIIFVGRLEIIKGLQDVIPLFVENDSVELWILGKGDYESVLKKLAGDANNIRFLGFKSQDEIRPLYANAIAAIAPSLCYEVFPLVLLEAFRESTPVIVRNLGPYPEVVNKSDAGFTFNSSDELKLAINQLANNKDLRNKMGAAGRAAYEKYWSEKASMDKYFSTIKQIAEKKNRVDTLKKLSHLTSDHSLPVQNNNLS